MAGLELVLKVKFEAMISSPHPRSPSLSSSEEKTKA